MGTKQAPSFADAEAWQVQVKETRRFPETGSRLGSRPSFSHDFRRIAYVYFSGERSTLLLVVRAVGSWQMVTSITLPMDEIISISPSPTPAWSPDDKKIALLNGYNTRNRGTNVLFIDLDSSRITGVLFQAALPSNARLVWPNAATLRAAGFFLAPSFMLDLDTLGVRQYSPQVDNVPKELTDYAGKDLQISNHKNCLVELKSYGFEGLGGQNLVVHSRHHPHTRLLLRNVVQGDGMTDDDWIFWTPDLQYVVFHPHAPFQEQPATLVRLGTTSSPMLDFAIDTAADSVSAEQLGQLKSAFAGGKRVWASVFERRVNPLNGRLLGPDEARFRGQGYLTQIEPTPRFRYSFEAAPARPGDVVSHFLVENTWDWGNKAWGELATATEAATNDAPPGFRDEKEQMSYSIGMSIGKNIKEGMVDLDMDMFHSALMDNLAGNPMKMTDEEMKEGIRAYQQAAAKAKHPEAPAVGEAPKVPPGLSEQKERVSYSIGMSVGKNIKDGLIDLDMDVFKSALKDYLSGKTMKMTAEQMREGIQAYQAAAKAKRSPGSPPQDAGPRTKLFLTQIGSALETYKLNIGHYPSREEAGLKALLVKPECADTSSAERWQGPYLKPGTKIQDAWGHDLVYECPGKHNPASYDLLSMGSDGRVGGGDDIANY